MKTLEFKNILAPFDFNSQFINSFKMAVGIARRSGARITLLNVLGTPETLLNDYVVNCVMPTNGFLSAVDEKKKAIFKFIEEEGFPINQIDIKVELGGFNENIIRLNHVDPFDIIIVPDFTKKSYQRLFADINPIRLMNDTKTAVIGVNRKLRLFSLKRIVLPIRDVENWYDKIPFTAAIARLSGAEIMILGVTNSNSEMEINNVEQKISLCVQNFKLHNVRFSTERIYGHGDPFWDIAIYSRYKSADLIIVSPQISSPILNTYLNNNLYNKLISEINIPVMGVTLT